MDKVLIPGHIYNVRYDCSEDYKFSLITVAFRYISAYWCDTGVSLLFECVSDGIQSLIPADDINNIEEANLHDIL